MIFQEYGVFPWLTVEENVGFGLLAQKRADRNPLLKLLPEREPPRIDLPADWGERRASARGRSGRGSRARSWCCR